MLLTYIVGVETIWDVFRLGFPENKMKPFDQTKQM